MANSDIDVNQSMDLEISLESRRRFLSIFGPFSSSEDERKAMQIFADIAISEFLDWAMGSKRYRTLTEQYIDWIEQVYTNFFPEGETPSAERIYNSLNIPYGQAAYIARVLCAKTLAKWRSTATIELFETLKDNITSARAYVSQGEQFQAIQMQMSKMASIELQRICSAKRNKDRSYLLPQLGGSSGDYRFVSIPACTIVDLVQNSDWKKEP